MIVGIKFTDITEEYFYFLKTEFDFELVNEKNRVNVFYDIQYKNKFLVVSISYENIEDYLAVIIFILENGELPDYDDKTKSINLSEINETVLSCIDPQNVRLNNQYFSHFRAVGKLEKRLLKSAKELRLHLKYGGLSKYIFSSHQ